MYVLVSFGDAPKTITPVKYEDAEIRGGKNAINQKRLMSEH